MTMETLTAQNETGRLRRVLLKHARDAFRSKGTSRANGRR